MVINSEPLLLAFPFSAPDALVALLAQVRPGGPLDLRLRQLKAGDQWSMVRLRVEDLGGEDDGLVVQKLVMHLRAPELGKHCA